MQRSNLSAVLSWRKDTWRQEIEKEEEELTERALLGFHECGPSLLRGKKNIENEFEKR